MCVQHSSAEPVLYLEIRSHKKDTWLTLNQSEESGALQWTEFPQSPVD